MRLKSTSHNIGRLEAHDPLWRAGPCLHMLQIDDEHARVARVLMNPGKRQRSRRDVIPELHSLLSSPSHQAVQHTVIDGSHLRRQGSRRRRCP